MIRRRSWLRYVDVTGNTNVTIENLVTCHRVLLGSLPSLLLLLTPLHAERVDVCALANQFFVTIAWPRPKLGKYCQDWD
jgi:hypothetical protein